jgi:hypothetical protein
MLAATNRKEAGPVPNPFMKEWVTALSALDRQSSIFRLKKADYNKHRAIIQIAENVIQLSFDLDKNTLTWESKTPGFTLDCVCAGWEYSKKPSSTPDASFEAIISPVFTVGDQHFDIVLKRFTSTDKRVVEKQNIFTAKK